MTRLTALFVAVAICVVLLGQASHALPAPLSPPSVHNLHPTLSASDPLMAKIRDAHKVHKDDKKAVDEEKKKQDKHHVVVKHAKSANKKEDHGKHAKKHAGALTARDVPVPAPTTTTVAAPAPAVSETAAKEKHGDHKEHAKKKGEKKHKKVAVVHKKKGDKKHVAKKVAKKAAPHA
ncbi:hypothetical protein RI367_006699 [Sorochytrium milnesiophthora]